MIRYIRFIVCCSIVALASQLTADDSTVKPLQKLLNNKNYNLVYPPNNFIFAGGLVVADKKHTKFWGLPASALPLAPADINKAYQESWPNLTVQNGTDIEAIVTAIEKVFGGGLQLKHNSNLTLVQIDGTGEIVGNGDVLDRLVTNRDIVRKVTQWKKANYKVYFVSSAVNTSNLNVSSGADTDISAAFQGPVKTCDQATGSSPAPSTPTGGAPATAAATQAAAAPVVNAATTGGSPATAAATQAAASTPAVSACIGSQKKSQLTMNTKTPLIFAATLVEITVDNGNLVVSPLPGLAGTGMVQPPPPEPGMVAVPQTNPMPSPVASSGNGQLSESKWKDMSKHWGRR